MSRRSGQLEPGTRLGGAAEVRRPPQDPTIATGDPIGAGRTPPDAPWKGPAADGIRLWIDDYDDIFSDFDPRPFGLRALSEDFLAEVRRAVRDRRDGVSELQFLIPGAVRNGPAEATIRKRLREHFRKHAGRLRVKHRRMIRTSLVAAVGGFGLMLVSALLRGQPPIFWRALLNVVCEPSGWFAVWFGLDQLFYGTKKIGREYEFYRKMARSDVTFVDESVLHELGEPADGAASNSDPR